MANSKANYKVYDKVECKYLGTSKKKVWHREYAVFDFIRDLKRRGWKLENLEVHVFPIETAVVVAGTDFFTEYGVKAAKTKAEKMEKAHEWEKKSLERKIKEWETELESMKQELAQKSK